MASRTHNFFPIKKLRIYRYMQTQLELPPGLPAAQFIAALNQHFDLRLTGWHRANRTFYDSFDWRLYLNGWFAEGVTARKKLRFSLRQLHDNAVLDGEAIQAVPAFAGQFHQEGLKQRLEPVLKTRALLPVCSVEFKACRAVLVDADGKTVARLLIEDYTRPKCCRVTFDPPVKGYQNKRADAVAFMASTLAVCPPKKPLIDLVLSAHGKHPQDYSAKLNLNLSGDLPSDAACKQLYNRLLDIIQANETGVIANTDSEFLHDFRVAIRKTRTSLSQLKDVLPEAVQSEASEFFSWLGQITGPARDLDVCLLNLNAYKNCLPAFAGENLFPLADHWLAQQQHSHQELVHTLKSDRYLHGLAGWRSYLHGQWDGLPLGPAAAVPVKHLADLRIWKNYRRVLKQGDAIQSDSPPEALHELRKCCKKLRYLLEFFDSLYPKKQLAPLLEQLKALQEVLGNYQDYHIQETRLRQFAPELKAGHAPAETFIAVGMLMQHLNHTQHKARSSFAKAYQAFCRPKTRKGFKHLCTR